MNKILNLIDLFLLVIPIFILQCVRMILVEEFVIDNFKICYFDPKIQEQEDTKRFADKMEELYQKDLKEDATEEEN